MTGQLGPLHRSPTSTTQSRERRLKAAGNLLVSSPEKAKRTAEPKPRIHRAKHITPKNRPATSLQTAATAMTASPPGQWNRPEPSETTSGKMESQEERAKQQRPPSTQESDTTTGARLLARSIDALSVFFLSHSSQSVFLSGVVHFCEHVRECDDALAKAQLRSDARSPIAASPSAERAPVPARTSTEPTRRPFCHRRSESLPTNKVQAHRHLFFEKIATDNIQAVVEKRLQANPVAPTQAAMLASQCARGAAPATSSSCATGTAEELPQSPMQTEAPGQTQGPAGVPLPLSSDEDDEAMDFSNSRKRLREKSGDEDEHAPRKQTATTPSESSEEQLHVSQGSEELSRSEFRTTVKSEVASTTADMTSSATTGSTDPASSDAAGTCQLPTTASTDDLSAPGDPCSPSPTQKDCPCQQPLSKE
ncbi:hypothetical protein HPB51_026955 [Rhipicephalus microplus]|uniref:Uncharacterized protein n=1 Tax=Rhipicephalus microplus TaxID=6941 RepID=A0A9J6D1K3_RHIMP|nr:hypothetical protein HPB51_026955 [Rhipicephalus microplus]